MYIIDVVISDIAGRASGFHGWQALPCASLCMSDCLKLLLTAHPYLCHVILDFPLLSYNTPF